MKEQSKQPSALRRFFMRCAAKKELIYLIIGAVTVLASTVLLICRIAAGSANFLQIVTMALMIVGGICMILLSRRSDTLRKKLAQAGGASSTVEELKQYKALLDAGVLTEEEFAAKKRQLLGI